MFYFLSFLSDEFSWLNIFRYITFRTGGALLTAFAIGLIAGPRFIAWLKSKQANGQPIRSNGPATHLAKQGTPTMGGLLILIAILIATLLWANLLNPYVWVLLFVLLGFGLAGFLDDYLKLTENNSKGVSGWQKIGLQAAVSIIACVWMISLENGSMGTTLTLPFFKNIFLDLSYFYIPFVLVVFIGTSNAVNLTDGKDGLATGCTIFCTLTYAAFAYLMGHRIFAGHLNIPYIMGAEEAMVFAAAVCGACIGFLWHNCHPASMFMGDTGSLALGGAVGMLAVIVRQELLLILVGGVYVMEAVSVILQVASFRLTGKRIFLCAPIHHHFERKGWTETQIVVRFWILAGVFSLMALATLKLR